jgi:phage recombination protein Bet
MYAQVPVSTIPKALVPTSPKSILATMASVCGMEPKVFQATLMKTVMPAAAKDEDVAAFLVICNEYKLNPFARQVFAFPASGGIRPMVSIDGWYGIANQHPQFDGIETEEVFATDHTFIAVKATVWRKDRTRPIVVTEYLDECKRATEPWKMWPKRMLRHKASIQAFRAAFGLAGIYDEDEIERIVAAEVVPNKPESLAVTTERIKEATKKIEERALVEVQGLKVFENIADSWPTWEAEAIVKSADSKSPLKGHSWKTATLGSSDGGRHSMLKQIVKSAVTRCGQTGSMPGIYDMKAAITLQRLENRLLDEQIAKEGEAGVEAPIASTTEDDSPELWQQES